MYSPGPRYPKLDERFATLIVLLIRSAAPLRPMDLTDRHGRIGQTMAIAFTSAMTSSVETRNWLWDKTG